MVEDYVPDRLEFELNSAAKSVSRAEPAQVTLEGRYLYGAPAAGLEVAGEVDRRTGVRARRLCRLPLRPVRRADRVDAQPARRSAGDRQPPAAPSFPVSLDKVPQATRPLEARVTVRLAEAGRPRGRAQAHAAGDGRRADDRRAAAVLRPLARRGRAGDVRRRRRRARRRGADAQRSALRTAAGRDPLSMVSPRQHLGLRAGEADAAHRRRPAQRHRRHAGAAVAAGAMGPLSARDLDRRARRSGDLDRLRRRLVHRSDRRHARHARGRARQAGIRARREHDRCGHGAHRRQGHAERDRRAAADDRHAGRAAGHRAAARSGRQGLGHRRLCGRDLAASARRQCPAHARPRHRRAVVQRQPQGAHAGGEHGDAAAHAARTARCAFRSRSAGSPPARRRASSSPPSMSASSTSPTTGRRRRTTTISASAVSPPSCATSTASSSTACRARAARSGAAATSRRRSCKAARRRRSRWRSIPAWSRSSPTAPPRSCSTSPTSPAPPA